MTKITIIDANPEQIKGEVPTIQCDSKYSLCKIDRNFIQENRNDRWCSSEAYWFGARAPEPEVSAWTAKCFVFIVDLKPKHDWKQINLVEGVALMFIQWINTCPKKFDDGSWLKSPASRVINCNAILSI